MDITPFADRYLVQLDTEKKSDDFIQMPLKYDAKAPSFGTVVGLPAGTHKDLNQLDSTKPQLGDRVAFHIDNGVKFGDKLVIRFEYIICSVKESV